MSILHKLIFTLSLAATLAPGLAHADRETDVRRIGMAQDAAIHLLEAKGHAFLSSSSFIDVKLLRRGEGIRYAAKTGGGVGNFVLSGKILRGQTASAKIVSRPNASSATRDRIYARAR